MDKLTPPHSPHDPLDALLEARSQPAHSAELAERIILAAARLPQGAPATLKRPRAVRLSGLLPAPARYAFAGVTLAGFVLGAALPSGMPAQESAAWAELFDDEGGVL